MSNINISVQCFEENLQSTDRKNNPKDFNLYQGLLQMAQAIEEMERKISNIEHDVSNIKRK